MNSPAKRALLRAQPTFLTTLLLGAFGSVQAVEISQDSDHLRLAFDNEVELTFSLDGERLLGLTTATVSGISTSAADTTYRPILAEDMFGTPVMTHAFRLTDIEQGDDQVTLVLEARFTSSTEALQGFYTMAPDTAAVIETTELKVHREAAGKAQAELRARVLRHDKKAAAAQGRLDDLLAAAAPNAPEAKQVFQVRLDNAHASVDKAIGRALGKALKDDPEAIRLQAVIAAHESARKAEAVQQGKLRIHTDYFGQAIPHLPAETAQIDNVSALSSLPGAVAGTLRWTFTAESTNVAGWDWRGWQQQVAYEGLPGSPAFRVLRRQGTWELGGEAVGSTVVAMRYRGLGSIEETFADDGNGGIDRCFTTTETLPGAAGGVPVISPAVPKSENSGDRGWGMRHRLSAWIGAMARGGGANVVDFQYRPAATYASFPIRQGNLRSCTEAFPGDRHISQRDEEWFASGTTFSSTPVMHLVLAPGQEFSRWESITRWQEMDQYVRDLMADELGMIQPEPLPAAGYNTDYNWEGRIGALSGQIESVLGPQGVRMILQHQPGWINGRDLRTKKDPRYAGGGDCTPYDFTAEGEIAAAWKRVSQACAKWDIDYYAWLSTIAHKAGDFAVDVDKKQGGLQASWGEIGNGVWTRSRDLYAFDPPKSLLHGCLHR
jgi:hypothetical protein